MQPEVPATRRRCPASTHTARRTCGESCGEPLPRAPQAVQFPNLLPPASFCAGATQERTLHKAPRLDIERRRRRSPCPPAGSKKRDEGWERDRAAIFLQTSSDGARNLGRNDNLRRGCCLDAAARSPSSGLVEMQCPADIRPRLRQQTTI